MASKILKTTVSLAGALDPSLAKSLQNAEKHFEQAEKAIKSASKALAAFSGAAIAGTTAAIGILAKSGNDYIRTMNGIQAQTGLTGQALEEMETSARELYKSGMGENFQEVADALVNIKQTSGLVGDELQAAANNALLLKDTFEMEVNESTRAASALMKNFGITADEAYGLIAKGAQSGANKNGDLLDTLNEYSVHYKALGLDAEQFVSSLIAGAEAGSFSIDKVGDAVKEFTIRSKDGSKASLEAFEAIGLNGNQMTKAFASGGEAAEAAFFKTVQALDAIKDPVKQNAAGVALFGTMFEDLESGVLKTLGSMGDASIDAVDTLKQIEKVKYNDVGYAFTQIWRTLQDGLIPAAEKIGQAIFEQMPLIKSSIEQLMPVIVMLADSFADSLPLLMTIFTDVLQAAIPVISQLITQLTPFLNDIMVNFAEILELIGPPFIELISAILPPLMAIIQALIPPFMQVVNGILPPLIELATALAPVITLLATLLGTALTQALNIVIPIVQNIINIFSNLLNFLTNIFTGKWGEAWGNVVEIFKNLFLGIGAFLNIPLNAVIGMINTVISGLNMIKLPDWVPLIGGKGINIPQIPMLAEGGFTNGVSIAGEAGTEAVISFAPAHRADNISIWEKAGSLLGVTAGGNQSIEIGGITFNIDISGASSPQDVVSELKNNIHDIVDELVEELSRRQAGSYGTSIYVG